MKMAKVKIKKVEKISIVELQYLILCFFLYTPSGLKNYSERLDTVFKWGLLVLSLVYIVYKTAIKHYPIRKNSENMVFLFMLLYFFVVNCIKAPSTLLSETATFLVPALGILVLFQQRGLLTSRFWKALVLYSKAMLIINFLTTIIFPKGIYVSGTSATYDRANWLFGSRNNMAVYIIFFFTIVYLDDLFQKRQRGRQSAFSYKLFFYICLALFPVFMCGDNGLGFLEGSSTGIVGVGFLCAICFFLEMIDMSKSKLLGRIFEPKLLFLIIAAVSFVLILGNVEMGVLSAVTGLFGKNTTFTGRTYVWRTAISYILKSPIFGYGEVDFVLRSLSFTDVTYVYNGILRMLLSYGFVGLIWFTVFLLIPFAKNKVGIYQKACMCGICALLVVGMMNEFATLYIITLAFIAENLNQKVTAPSIVPKKERVVSTAPQNVSIATGRAVRYIKN